MSLKTSQNITKHITEHKQSGASCAAFHLKGAKTFYFLYLRSSEMDSMNAINAINAIKISFAAMCSRKLFMIFRKIAKNK